jgi:hypothetical protein
MKTIAVVLFFAAICGAQPKPFQPKPFQPKPFQPQPFQAKPAPQQPIPFSHRKHAEEAGVKCLDCHTIRPPGDAAGIPAEAVCMGCHQTIERDSDQIRTLAKYAAGKKPVPWVRVYKLPKTVYFSHQVHAREAKVDCAVCHGPVAARDSLGQEKSIAMADCMDCHDRYKASNDCNLCHDSH